MKRTLSINGTVCSSDITILSIDYGYATVTTYEDWLKNSTDPLFYGQDTQYTTAALEILVEADGLGALEKKCSNLYTSMKKAVIKDSAVDFSLDGFATNVQEQRLGPKARTLTVSFQGIKVAERQEESLVLGLTAKPLTVNGNNKVSTIIEVLPEKNYVTLTLVVNDREYVLKNVTYITDENPVKNMIVIDGENGTVTRNGESYIDHYDSWDMPKLDSGVNQISCPEGYPTVKFKFSGRWT
nr:MAG TPA: hypothetical protein [Caudoviricetes sp.]